MNKLKLFVDFDTTMIDSTTCLINCYRDLTGEEPLTYKDWTWNISTAYPNCNKEIIHKCFDIPLFFKYAKDNIFPNCKETLQELTKYYDITVVSCGTEDNLRLKEQFLKEEFTFVSFVGLQQSKKTFDKSCVCKDGVLIDDRLDCLLSSKQCLNILFRYNNNPYEWQEGYKDLIENGKISYVATKWNDELKDILLSWYQYNNR